MAVSKRLRYEVLRRDNHACRYCGATAPGVKLNVDHVIPQALGGSDKPDNLVTSCTDCNAGKTSSMPNAQPITDVDQEAFRQAVADKQAASKQRELVAAHLYATWRWAWERTGSPAPVDGDVRYFARRLFAMLNRGLSAQLDLTEIVFQAGSDLGIDPTDYLPLEYLTEEERAHRAVPTDEEFERARGAYPAWWAGWEKRDPAPPADWADHTFRRQLRQALTAGFQGDVIAQAAHAAGLAMSAELVAFLPETRSSGGGN
ncbi:HNH endonuclease [Streptomyces spectabilis]|uniref:HNH endonuclease n=1 Tax=Streptomyces spectabilis TaxID=68270 RepID=A0A5P2X6F8_STRST|nr:HNH endonuclease [Streptomyces spectabilis]MBB5108374.1 hypothetical protein [Streptomyces spectabilis]MCI3901131.1 HNH endonuclease [Streptomyces spectabilis]QEV58620.1 HNH endonuclease [Streptomyces spectabilis]GGV46153.1 hypothetical protein GCM10010245_72370 [Streptomyces spectabilis]